MKIAAVCVSLAIALALPLAAVLVPSASAVQVQRPSDEMCAAGGGCVYATKQELIAILQAQADKAFEAGKQVGSEDTRMKCRNFVSWGGQ